MSDLTILILVVIVCAIGIINELQKLNNHVHDIKHLLTPSHVRTPDVHATRSNYTYYEEPIETPDERATHTHVPQEPILPDADLLTKEEMERFSREESFDERIRKMKDELAHNTADKLPTHSTSVAEELHPDVHNLPHNIINDTYVLPDVEITD